jgi:hypothetical protein
MKKYSSQMKFKQKEFLEKGNTLILRSIPEENIQIWFFGVVKIFLKLTMDSIEIHEEDYGDSLSKKYVVKVKDSKIDYEVIAERMEVVELGSRVNLSGSL